MNVVVVLDEPLNVVNIAGVIRGMKNMGLSRLRLVRPVDFDTHRIQGIAHRSADIIAGTELHDTLEGAIADGEWVVGTSARPRTANRNYVRPREVAPTIVERATEGPVCILFGREDRGLTNEAMDLCHAVSIIPTAPEYWSLNLAQAFLVTAYEIFLAAGGAEGALPRGPASNPSPPPVKIWRACTRPFGEDSPGSTSSREPGSPRPSSASSERCSEGPIWTSGRPAWSRLSVLKSGTTWTG